MSALDNLPAVESLFGIDLKTGSMIIAAIGMVHPMAYGCTLFLPLSYILVTIWALVAFYFAFSVTLLVGLMQNEVFLCTLWVWYSLVFVALMMLMMVFLFILHMSMRHKTWVMVVVLGMLWYILHVYFIFVVNSYRQTMKENQH